MFAGWIWIGYWNVRWSRVDLASNVLVGSCRFLAWLLFTPATDTFSLSPTTAFLWSRLCFHFRPASLPVFCCWVSSSSRYMLVLLSVFMVRWVGGVILSLLLVCWYINCDCFFGGDFQLCYLALVLASRDAVVVVLLVIQWWWCCAVVMQGWWRCFSCGGWGDVCWWWWWSWCVVGVVIRFLGVVVGDFFSRYQLLFGSIYVVASSCLSFGC